MKRTKFPPKEQPVPINLIRSIAWTFYKTTKVNWDELFSEACLQYCISLKHFNPAKGASYTTWAYMWIRGELINFCKKEARTKSIPNIEWIEKSEDPMYEFFKNNPNLPEDCLFIIEMVLANPTRYSLTPRKAISLIRQDLKNNCGWTWSRIYKSLTTLKEEALSPKLNREVYLI